MKSDVLSDAEFQRVVRNLLEAAVPERKEELGELWEAYKLCFERLADNSLDVSPGVLFDTIVFSPRSMRLFWLASFIAWEALMEVEMTHTKGVSVAQLTKAAHDLSRSLKEQGSSVVVEMFKEVFERNTDDDLSRFDEVPETFVRYLENQDISVIEKIISSASTGAGRFDEMFEEFVKLYKEKDISTIKMPEGVPEPCCAQYSDLQEPHVLMAMDLAKLAVAWVFFHEIKHVQDQHERGDAEQGNFKKDKKELHRDEFACDEYATKFLLKKVEQYAQDCAVDPSSAKSNRVLGIYIALFAMTLMKAGDWGESEKHPAMQDRIDNVTKYISSSGTGVADWIVHDIFDRLQHKWPNTSTPAP